MVGILKVWKINRMEFTRNENDQELEAGILTGFMQLKLENEIPYFSADISSLGFLYPFSTGSFIYDKVMLYHAFSFLFSFFGFISGN